MGVYAIFFDAFARFDDPPFLTSTAFLLQFLSVQLRLLPLPELAPEGIVEVEHHQRVQPQVILRRNLASPAIGSSPPHLLAVPPHPRLLPPSSFPNPLSSSWLPVLKDGRSIWHT